MAERVQDAVEQYLAENGFTKKEYTAPFVTFYLGPLSFPFPNPPGRQKLVALHDIHHVVTGFGTDVIGEGEQGAWELRAGCPSPTGIFYNGLAMLTAFFVAPRRVLRAFRAAKGAETLYVSRVNKEAALEMTLHELRGRLGVPAEGIARAEERHLHSHAAELRAKVAAARA